MADEATSSVEDPQKTINAVVDNVKSEGLFDHFRKECLESYENMETYHQLKQRVENHVASFLSKYKHKKGLQKNTLRNMIRAHVNKSDVLLNSIKQLVDEVLSLKGHSICLRIDKQVDKYLSKMNNAAELTDDTGESSSQNADRNDATSEAPVFKESTEENVMSSEPTEIEEVEMEITDNIYPDSQNNLLDENNVREHMEGVNSSVNETVESYRQTEVEIRNSAFKKDEANLEMPISSKDTNNDLDVEKPKEEPIIAEEKSDVTHEQRISNDGEKNGISPEQITLASYIQNDGLTKESPKCDVKCEKTSLATTENENNKNDDEICTHNEPTVSNENTDYLENGACDLLESGENAGTETQSNSQTELSQDEEDEEDEEGSFRTNDSNVIPPLITEPISDDSASNHSSSFYEDRDTPNASTRSLRRKSTRVRALPKKFRDSEDARKGEDTDSISSNDIDLHDVSEENARGRAKRVSATKHVRELKDEIKGISKNEKRYDKRKRSSSPSKSTEETSSEGKPRRNRSRESYALRRSDASPTRSPIDNSSKRARRSVKERKRYSPS